MPKKDDEAAPKKQNRYSAMIGTIFKNHYKQGKTQFEFSREEFVEIAKSLKNRTPEEPGRHDILLPVRTALPDDILATAGKDRSG